MQKIVVQTIDTTTTRRAVVKTGLAKVAVLCSADTLMIIQTLVVLKNILVKSPTS